MNEFERGFTEELEKLAKAEMPFVTSERSVLGFPLKDRHGVMLGGDFHEVSPEAIEYINRFYTKGSSNKTAAKSVTMGSDIPKPKTMDSLMKPPSTTGYKGMATSMRSPLSQITALKPPKQTFYTGQ